MPSLDAPRLGVHILDCCRSLPLFKALRYLWLLLPPPLMWCLPSSLDLEINKLPLMARPRQPHQGGPWLSLRPMLLKCSWRSPVVISQGSIVSPVVTSQGGPVSLISQGSPTLPGVISLGRPVSPVVVSGGSPVSPVVISGGSPVTCCHFMPLDVWLFCDMQNAGAASLTCQRVPLQAGAGLAELSLLPALWQSCWGCRGSGLVEWVSCLPCPATVPHPPCLHFRFWLRFHFRIPGQTFENPKLDALSSLSANLWLIKQIPS